jgi:hypothetical protein
VRTRGPRPKPKNNISSSIPVVSPTDTPEDDMTWTSFYGNVLHPDYRHPCFFRHNGTNVDLFNWYNGDTVYIIARGPSIGKHLENKEIKNLLLNPAICKFGMNTSPEIVDNNVNLWAGVDKLTKFSSSIYKNPNITKFIPLNRYNMLSDGSKDVDKRKSIAYKDSKNVHVCHCPNTVGVQSFLMEQHPKTKLSFGQAYLGSTAALYGYYKGMKSVFLFTLKLCILLGFKRVIMLGVDFTMDQKTPYYKNTSQDYPKFHVDHNNKLYGTLAPMIKEIHKHLESGDCGYTTKLLTATPIASMPFIEVINLKEELKKELDLKS